MSGEGLLSQHLPHLLPSQRLRDIASLELVWPLKMIGTSWLESALDESHLERIFDILSSSLPNLAYLHLALKAGQVDHRPVNLQSFFKPIDEYVRRHQTALEHLTISPSRSVFSQIVEEVQKDSSTELRVLQLSTPFEEVWRNLDGTFVMIRTSPGLVPRTKRLACGYNKPPHRNSGILGTGDGYWIVQGDINNRTLRESCF